MPVYRKGVIRPWQLALLGLPLLVGGVVGPAMLPSALADERAYSAAPSCPEGTPSQKAGECRAREQATVLDKPITGVDRYKNYYLVLGIEDGTRQRVRLQAGIDNQAKVNTGDRVTVTSWRHEIREMTTDDAHEQLTTKAYPVGSYLPLLLVGVCLTPMGGVLLWMAYWIRRLRRTGRSVEFAGRRHTSVPFTTAMLYAIGAVIAVVSSPGPATGVAAAGGVAVVAVVLGALSWRRQRDRAARKGAELLAQVGVGAVPVADTVVPGRVMGEVPYSREGDNHLVVGPSGLAATADPYGRTGRVPLPATLTFVRLHGGVPMDVRSAGIPRPLFVECRDGDREVLLAVGSDAAPWIMGVLGARTPAAVGR